MRPETLCGLLAEEERVRAFAAVVLGAGTPTEVAAASGLPARDAVRALRRLEQGGLLESVGGQLTARVSLFKDAYRDSPAAELTAAEPLDPDRQRDLVLRAFIRDGRLVSIPVPRAKRRVILEHLATCFEPGVRYPERAVNAILRAWYDDHAALRRYLVDEQFLERGDGLYWRIGGPVDVA